MALVGFMCTSGRDGELTRRSECALVANVEGLGPACWWLLRTSQSRWLVWSRRQAAYEFSQSGVTLLWDRRGWAHVVDFLACAVSLEWYRLASCWYVWDKIQCTLTKVLGFNFPPPSNGFCQQNFSFTCHWSCLLWVPKMCQAVSSVSLTLFQLGEMFRYFFFISMNRFLKRNVLKNINTWKVVGEVWRQVVGTTDNLS